MAAETLLGERITACAGPVFTIERNTGKFACATWPEVVVASFPRLSLVLLQDWCVAAKFIADRDASRLSDSDAFFIRVRVLPNSMKMEALVVVPRSQGICALALHERV